MANFPIRRSQLIAPFGVGALQMVRDGTSVITAGLDVWFSREDGAKSSEKIEIAEYEFEEWRLQELLGVNHFRLPPDHRSYNSGEQVPNLDLTIPFLRFPQWHFCPRCRQLEKLPLTARNRQKCQNCHQQNKTSYLVQVPIVAMCARGHLQDFPWREWVHHMASPTCQGTLQLVATGGASLSAQKVKCSCGAERSLGSVTDADPNGDTFLSKNLSDEGPYTCRGHRPWLGTEDGEACSMHLRGSLRSASNLYFADIKSAIYLPRETESVPPELFEILDKSPLRNLLEFAKQKLGSVEEITPEFLRSQQSELLLPFQDEQIKRALQVLANGNITEETKELEEDQETAFRRAEFRALQVARQEDQLTTREEAIDAYSEDFRKYFSKILLVTRLRETRAFTGFTRVYPENDQSVDERRSLLWRRVPPNDKIWLPAYKVYGEGIFLVLNESRLQQWEQRRDVQARVQPLIERYQALQENRHLRERPLSARFVLIHTLAHLVINQLTFDCGYSTASLRERLYVSTNEQEPMAGILIYTASGDAEGTMGGLVRMGKPGVLERVVTRALDGARWCSADPVCMEIGAQGGQGPDSCNLAACHNCALVPETACEEFNRFLDRALLIGEPSSVIEGFFQSNKM